MAMQTLLDIMKINASEGLSEVIDEAARLVPEVSGQTVIDGQIVKIPGVADARTITGTQYKTLVRTALPTTQFRNVNEGITPSASTYENRLVECFVLNCRYQADVAAAKANADGEDALLAEEAVAQLTSASMLLGKQFYYGTGTGGDAKGHPGLLASVDSSMVVDAAGTTDSVASSVWSVKFGPSAVRWVMGQDGQLEVTDKLKQLVNDPNDSTKQLLVVFQELLAWVGLQVKHKYACGRIKKLTTDSGKGLTDDLIADLLSKAPVGFFPDALFMSRRSRKQLQDSRTATNSTGAPAPFPTESFGVPIIVTDSILDTETLTL